VFLVTHVKIDDSRAAVRGGDLDEALDDARAAGSVQPWAAAPYTQEALVQERLGDLVNARVALSEARERAPEDWRLWLIEARLRRAQGDEPGALAASERARQLNPRSPIFR